MPETRRAVAVKENAERQMGRKGRRLWAAPALVCAAVGLVCFGWLLRVDLPEGPIERTFYTYVR